MSKSIGQIAYEAAAKENGDAARWGDANQCLWHAAAKAVRTHIKRATRAKKYSQKPSPQPSLLKTDGAFNSSGGEVKTTGKYWGFSNKSWFKVVVISVPGEQYGSGALLYAPIPRKTKSATGGAVAVNNCSVLFGPLKAWGDSPPRIPKKKMIEKGVLPCHLEKKNK